MEREHGVPWNWMEKKIRADLDATFDDEKFVKMDPDSRIDAAFCRKEFKEKLVDYLLWMTHSDVIEW